MESALEEVRKECVLRGLSEKTQAAYLNALAHLQRHFKKEAAIITKDEIKSYLLHLIQVRHLSQSSVTTAYSAIKFFFKNMRHDSNRIVA